MTNNYSNGIISKPNISNGNPYGVNRIFIARVAISETIQIPMLNEQQGIEMVFPDNLFQTNNPANIGEKQYYIDYASQIIYFNPKQIGQKIVFVAYDMGEDLIMDHKICTLVDNFGNPVETLKDILDKGFEALDYLNTVGSAVEITELLKAEIENGLNVSKTLQEKINIAMDTNSTLISNTSKAKSTNDILVSNDTKAKATNTLLVNSTTSAENKRVQVIETINNAENKRVEVERATTSADTSKSQLQTVIDDSVVKRSQHQTTINDSVVKKNELLAVIGQADISTMKNDITSLQTNKLNKSDLLVEIKKVHGSGSGLNADLVDGCNVDDTLTTETNLWSAKKVRDTIFTSFRGGLGLVGGNNWTNVGVAFPPDIVTHGAFTWLQLDITGSFSNNGAGVAGITSTQNRPKINIVLPCICANGNTFYNGYMIIEMNGTIKAFCSETSSFTRFFGSGMYPSIN